jgi:YVTN family beta-propeller protein
MSNVHNSLVDPRPRAASFTDDSQQLWVTSEMAGTLMILDAKSKDVIKKIPLEVAGVSKDKVQPVGVIVDKDSRWGYVALGPANRVAVINAQTFAVEKYLLVGERVWNLAFSPDQKRLYTTNGRSSDISIIDLENHKVVKSIKVGRFPWGVAVKP